jgi:hypothetical protein
LPEGAAEGSTDVDEAEGSASEGAAARGSGSEGAADSEAEAKQRGPKAKHRQRGGGGLSRGVLRGRGHGVLRVRSRGVVVAGVASGLSVGGRRGGSLVGRVRRCAVAAVVGRNIGGSRVSGAEPLSGAGSPPCEGYEGAAGSTGL